MDPSNHVSAHNQTAKMLSAKNKVILSHVFSFALAAGAGVFLLRPHLGGSAAEVAFYLWIAFWWLFAIGALILGAAGLLRLGFLHIKGIRARKDISVDSMCEETEMLNFYAGEFCFGLTVTVLIHLRFGWLPSF